MGSAQDDVVPHIIIRSPRLRSGKIVFGDAKRLLQHYRHKTDMLTALRNVRYRGFERHLPKLTHFGL